MRPIFPTAGRCVNTVFAISISKGFIMRTTIELRHKTNRQGLPLKAARQRITFSFCLHFKNSL
jgi:hypothetical protein